MYATRLKAVLAVLALACALLVGGLIQLQILEGSRYRDEAIDRLRRAPGYTPTIRGTIYDRNGVVLARDTGAFDVAVYYPFLEMDEAFVGRMARQWGVGRDEVVARVRRMWTGLARLTDVPEEELFRRADTIRARVAVIQESVAAAHGRAVRVREATYGERTSLPHPLVYDVDLRTVGAIESRPEDFPGLTVQVTRKREYCQGGVAPHIVGRLGEVSREELQDHLNADYPPGHLRRYWPGDWIGRGGVEGACETALRGTRGMAQKGAEGDSVEDIDPVPGQDVHLTLDVALQADVEGLLDHPPAGSVTGRVVGAAVVLDCQTGEVLVLATSPRYDPRSFQADYAALEADAARPLVNRATSGLYPLGSVFKAVTTTAGLHEGTLTPQTTLTCDGMLDPARPDRFRCDIYLSHGGAHGTIALRTAIQKSCNVYFYQVAELLGRGPSGRTDLRLARDRLQAWAARLGLGQPTGIGLGGEAAGNIRVGDPRNLAVGQGELLVTPLQVAQLYALVATDGRMPALRLIREPAGPPHADPASPPQGWATPGQSRPPLGLNPRHMAVLRDALTAVVNEPGGTAYGLVNLPDIRIAGKTGTAQAGVGEPHAWFAGFAPADRPRIALAVIVEHGGHGGTVAGPIVREIVRACQTHGYFGDRPPSVPGPGGPSSGGGLGRDGQGRNTAPPAKSLQPVG